MLRVRHIFVWLTAAVVVAATSGTAAAAPAVTALSPEPNHVEVGVSTVVRITASIPDPDYIAGSANLQRRRPDGTWIVAGVMRDDGTVGDLVPGDKIFTLQLSVRETVSSDLRFRASAAFRRVSRRVMSDEIHLPVGVVVPAGAGATIPGAGGLKLIIPPDSVPYDALFGIVSLPRNEITAPSGHLPIVAAVNVIHEPLAFNSSVLPATRPFIIEIPAPASSTAVEYLIGHQVLSDSIGPPAPGLKQQIVIVDTASRAGSRIVGDGGTTLSGAFGSGPFIILENIGSGFATGVVSDAGGPRRGAVVSSNTNTVVAVTDSAGRYNLYISGGPFTVTAFDPLRGSLGSVAGNVPTHNAVVTANILVTPVASPPITRDGIRNGGFERGDLTGWALVGSGTARPVFSSTGISILPREGGFMADINTGSGAVGDVGSSLKQNFRVPAGVRTLRFDFNFLSEEFPEFVGTEFDDSFRAIVTTPGGSTTFATVSVNESGGFTLIGDCGFPGGDDTCGMTGWRTGSVDLSPWAGTNTPITVELLFSADDRGDNVYDSHVLIDNIRFATLWIDAKIISGAAASATRVENEVLAANEILSQAGLNVRIRNTRTVADPGGLLDTDLTWAPSPNCVDGRVNGRLTVEETTLMGLLRGGTATDLNVYYVRSATGLAGVGGFAINPDDFCVDVNILTNSGTIHTDIGAGGNVLAHEVGHMTITPATAGNVLEHSAPAGNFMSTTPALGIVNRDQSASINQAAAPLLVP